MQRGFLIRGPIWLGGVVLLLSLLAAARADGPPEGAQAVVGPRDTGIVAPVKLSDYWIGLECYPVSDGLRVQLGLPENQGLLVEKVLEDGPAAKAGIRRYDVLVKAAGKPLEMVQDLIDAVDQAKDKTLTLELIRGGKPAKLDVKPVKRPEETIPPSEFRWPEDSNWEGFRKWFERIRPGEGGRPPLRFRFLHPGTILPPEAFRFSLPGNVTVSITKEGNKPAKIKVTRDGDKWELTEDDLDKLPADLRRYVEGMLGQAWHVPGGMGRYFDFDLLPEWEKRWEKPSPGEAPPKVRPESRLEKRLEDMDRQLDQMRKSIEQLRKSRPRLKTPEAKQEEV